MTRPIPPAEFVGARLTPSAALVDGLPRAIDAVADRAPASHAFLRRQWFDAAVATYGGRSRTLVVECGGAPMLALPFVATGPAWAGGASVAGCYWPFRSFPAATGVDDIVRFAALDALAGAVRVLRIGPVYDGDPAVAPFIEAARARGWAAIDRPVADSYRLDIAAARAGGAWPRTSTLKKNRFHEKHLAAHGALDWRFVHGSGWTPEAFDALADIERKSWIAARTNGSDAKFTAQGHGAFWRRAAADPAIAAMMWAAVLDVDGAPAAFSFDLNAGALKYAVANSYDPAFAKHSPGKLLYYRNLVRAIDDGITAVDWGAGDSGYKATIGAVEGPAIRDWLLVRPGVSARVARRLARIWAASGQRVAR